MAGQAGRNWQGCPARTMARILLKRERRLQAKGRLVLLWRAYLRFSEAGTVPETD